MARRYYGQVTCLGVVCSGSSLPLDSAERVEFEQLEAMGFHIEEGVSKGSPSVAVVVHEDAVFDEDVLRRRLFEEGAYFTEECCPSEHNAFMVRTSGKGRDPISYTDVIMRQKGF